MGSLSEDEWEFFRGAGRTGMNRCSSGKSWMSFVADEVRVLEVLGWRGLGTRSPNALEVVSATGYI